MKTLFLFAIAAALVPRQTTDATGTDTTPEPTIVVEPTTIFACSDAHARALLTQRIDPKYLGKPDELRLYITQLSEGKALC